ncbi:MAG TPA: NifB/NifX family molybdenum-iron cluster-binding protein [Azospirillum sp.]|nr:NifB/NifX family molybdenum-iron cluster-binding protein [Azospirillum sp.]
MKFAIATQDGATIATHGGRTRCFLLFDAERGAEPVAAGRLDLAEDMVLHLHGDGKPHPIDAVAVVVAGMSGQGFVNHMRRRGIEPVVTAESDPARAIRDYLAGTVKPAPAPEHPHAHHEGGHHHHH